MTRRRNKFNQVRATYDGQKYDSLGEAEYAERLDVLKRVGKIRDWARPKPIVLVDGKTARDRVTYRPDFVVIPLYGKPYYVDYKGSKATMTQVWRIKVKLWKQVVNAELRVAYHSGEEHVIVSGVL